MSFGSGRLPPTSPRSRLRDARGSLRQSNGIRRSFSSLTNVVHRGCCPLLQEELRWQSVWSGRSAATTWFEPTTHFCPPAPSPGQSSERLVGGLASLALYWLAEKGTHADGPHQHPLQMCKILVTRASSSASICLRRATHSREYLGTVSSSASSCSIARLSSIFGFSSALNVCAWPRFCVWPR